MQTRGAMRRAALAAATSGAGVDQVFQTALEAQTSTEDVAAIAKGSYDSLVSPASSELEDLPTPRELSLSSDSLMAPTVSGTKRKLGEVPFETTSAKAPVKRAHQAKKTAQPIKGGWVLPHGMGSATQGPATTEISGATKSPVIAQNPAVDPTAHEVASVDVEDVLSPSSNGSSSQDFHVDEKPVTPGSESVSTSENSDSVVVRSPQNAAPLKATPKKATPKKATPKKAAPKRAASRKPVPKKSAAKTATRETRVSFRVSKASAQTKANTKAEQFTQLEAAVQQEGVNKAVSSINEARTAVEDTEKIAEEPHTIPQEEISIGRITRFRTAASSKVVAKQEQAVDASPGVTETGSAVDSTEETADDSQFIHQEEVTTTPRVTHSRTAASTQTVVKHEQELPSRTFVVTKKEEVIEQTSSFVVTRKLLVFRGVTLNGNVVSKSFEKIIVDASQILDPDYRINVKRGKDNPYGLTHGYSPYPYRRVPTAEACEEVHRILTEMHGEVKQPDRIPAASLEIAGCGEVPCVLDALLRTLISGNTLMAMADAAIKKLGEDFGIRTEGTGAGSINWEKVRVSSHQALVNSIKISGNGPKKAQHIKLILDKVYEENLERMKQSGGAEKNEDGTTHDLLSLDYMHAMSKNEAMDKFVSFPGIGIKTAACVSLFCLRMPCFAVDTHVHKFCRWLGWTPVKADPDNVFRHGDFMVPDHLKYGLHQLFIRHGQTCFKCRKTTKPGSKDWNEAPDCPLEHLLDRSKDEAKPQVPKKPRKKAKKEDDDETSGEDAVVFKTEELNIAGAEDADEEGQHDEEQKDEDEESDDDDEAEEVDEHGKRDENNEEND